ncbi:MAG TPA: DMT family transporter [Halothiobacillus sp.]|nr:DMT family transporter [Halothiobacillus sp.]
MNLLPVYAMVIAATFFAGANFVLAGMILPEISTAWAAALRFLLGTLFLLPIILWQRAPVIQLIRRNWLAYLILGGVGITGFNLLFFDAMNTTTADNAALIMATNPLITTILAALILRERATIQQLIALPIALFGVMVVITEGDLSHLLTLHVVVGDWLMLGADIAWALYNVLSRRLMPKESSAIVNTTLVMGAGALILTSGAFLHGGPIQMPSAMAAMALALMVVGGTVAFYLFWNIGIQRLGSGRTAIFMNLVPVFAMLTGIALGTLPTAAQLVGGAIVLGGLSITMIPNRKNNRPAQDASRDNIPAELEPGD